MKYKLMNKNYNEVDYDTALYELLKTRGIDSPGEWLHPIQEYEINPFRLDGVKSGIELLHNSIKQRDNIQIIVDSDLDGYTSGALIYSFLTQSLKIENVSFTLHPGKEHGIVLKDIDVDTNLIIVPDAGSSQSEEHKYLLENGKKILVLDHHEVNNDFTYQEDLKQNIVIINNQLGEYKNKSLSGAGVTFKFIQAYCSQYGVPFSQRNYALAACGIIADVMDISILENKYIIDTGIKYMKEHPFLYRLIEKAHYNQKNPTPTIKDVGWVIGPNINAIIRLGTEAQKLLIFKAMVTPLEMVQTEKRNSEDFIPIFEEAVRVCENAKKRQSTALEKNVRIILSEIDGSKETNCIVFVDKDLELTFELSGLIANNLLSKFNKPVILLREFTEKNEKQYRGSVRGKPVDTLDNLKELMSGITGVIKADGNGFAFGVSIEKDNFEEFKAHINDALDKIDFNTNLYFVEMESRYNLIKADTAQLFSREDIWGQGVDKPMAILKEIPTDNYELMGADQQHIKINCGNYDVIIFKAPELAEKLIEGNKYSLDVVGEFSVDQSFNVGRMQFVSKDYNMNEYKNKTIYDFVF